MPAKIASEFNFFAKKSDRCVTKYSSALKHYNAGFDAAVKLENEIPIFFDTNVLLRTYSSSFVDREKLKTFFNNNKHRIFIVNQVQTEFMNNRETLIDEFHNNITNKIQDNFQTEIVNKVGNYFNSNKLILSDYPSILKKIEKMNKEVLAIYDEMKKVITASPQAKKEIKFTDDILDIYTQFEYTEKLEDDEISFLKQEFDTNKAGYSSENVSSKLAKVGVAFPGLGDIKEKPDDPYGDFIIFHEVLKYVKVNNKDVVLLTYDTTKGDWMLQNGEPHVHYIVNTYLNTDRSIYILDAKRVLQKLLEISPTSLTEIVEDEKLKQAEDWQTHVLQNKWSKWYKTLQSEQKDLPVNLLLKYSKHLSDLNPGEVWTLSVEEYMRKLTKEAKVKALEKAIEELADVTPPEKDEDD